MSSDVERANPFGQEAQPVTPQARQVSQETSEGLQEHVSPYPPCFFKNPEEKRLYNRLREIYQRHSHTWDKESRDAWPSVIEHASLAPSTIRKVTSHIIAKTLTVHNVTWAHVIVLRLIFKAQLYKSKKIMKTILTKYPRANFHTYAFSEDYRLPAIELPLVIQGEATKQVSVAQGDDTTGPARAPVAVMKSVENNKAMASLNVKREADPANIIKPEDRNNSSTSGFLNLPPHPGNTTTVTTAPVKKRKRIASEVAGDTAEKSSSDGQRPPKSRKIAPVSGDPSAGSKSTTMKPVVNSEGQPPRKSKLYDTTFTAILPAKQAIQQKDISNAAPASSTRIENPFKTIEKKLGEQEKSLEFLRRLTSTQSELINSLQKRVKQLEQNQQHMRPRVKKS